jgi:hypothetical protein
VLTRIELFGGAGQATLTVQNPRLYSSDGDLMEISSVTNASIAFDQPCVPLPPEDADNDGVEDVNDSDPYTPSTDFQDEHGGVATTGSIVSTGGATVAISDAPDGDPDEAERGVLVTVTGGPGPVIVDFCGEQASLPAPSTVVLTCGSALIAAQSGGSVVLALGTFTGTVTPISGVRITKAGVFVYNMHNYAFSQFPFIVGGLVIAPGATVNGVKDSDGDSRVDQADNCPFVANANQANMVHPGTPDGDACEDPDSDGVMDLTDNCPNNSNPGQENPDGDAFGSACDNCPAVATVWLVPAGDSDCDTFTDTQENFMGTLTGDRCAANSGLNNEPPPDGWPADFNDNQFINTVDVGSMVSVLGSTMGGGPPYNVRFDLNANGTINTVDVGRFVPVLGRPCVPD